ncbi:quinone-dependent dihydroorotate dehydrogenase [Sciscionella marina]|uniref:quinone-dependent dihydroorotate dehydrogenase n=1 Tax=Sciscionella marina TaxID=508770 RepID=UPI000371F177|nr:quinone-dependent dihydroorotate dehydrogenase [Sciscionella marina]
MNLYRSLLRATLFRIGGGDAEHAHEYTLRAIAALDSTPGAVRAGTRIFRGGEPVEVFGLRFPNRVGLAAGMDKDGRALPAWPALGFGFVEAGTVTWHPQPGNDRPRLYRLPESEAIINRMGFNNAGATALAARLCRLGPLGYPLGISIGKSKRTPVEEAVGDYTSSLRALHRYGDYFAINVSSPNTPGLRGLQDATALDGLLAALRAELDRLGARKPLLVKIAPDLSEPALDELLEVLAAREVDGVIATNTTLARDGIAAAEQPLAAEQGGLSGAPLRDRSLELVRFIAERTGGRLPIIGCGGIMDAQSARRMFDAGASLVQLYTGLIYRGPALVRAAARVRTRTAARRTPSSTG